MADGLALAKLAAKKKLMVAAAPDTFLGGSHQQARALVDEGRIGKVVAGTAHVMGSGMEKWHPNPDFFFKAGRAGARHGAVLYRGPGQSHWPCEARCGTDGMGKAQRVIGSGPRAGAKISVKTPTTIHALLEFASGAMVTLSASWDVLAHRHPNMELYGTEGALFLPDPNFFGGDVQVAGQGGDAKAVAPGRIPSAKPTSSTPMA